MLCVILNERGMKTIPKIIADPDICHGKPTFEGTRIMVWQILEILEAGGTQEEIYHAYPTLPEGAIEAVLHYAAEKAKGVRYLSFASHAPTRVPA